MPVRTFDMSRMPSRHVTHGAKNALQRMYYYAMGLDAEDIRRPHVGVGASWAGSDVAGDLPLRAARTVEQGVRAGGATPRTFGLIADGTNANADIDSPSALLVGRELVADSLELTVRGHSYDARRRDRRLRLVDHRATARNVPARRARRPRSTRRECDRFRRRRLGDRARGHRARHSHPGLVSVDGRSSNSRQAGGTQARRSRIFWLASARRATSSRTSRCAPQPG